MKVIEGARLPVYSWATDVEAEALRQARNLGNLEIAVDHAALMPDAHSGFGMPIGGVLFTDGAVVPYAIGVDIGCGVQVARTNLVWDDTERSSRARRSAGNRSPAGSPTGRGCGAPAHLVRRRSARRAGRRTPRQDVALRPGTGA
jgi:tRNA-splicing ligase RtcB